MRYQKQHLIDFYYNFPARARTDDHEGHPAQDWLRAFFLCFARQFPRVHTVASNEPDGSCEHSLVDHRTFHADASVSLDTLIAFTQGRFAPITGDYVQFLHWIAAMADPEAVAFLPHLVRYRLSVELALIRAAVEAHPDWINTNDSPFQYVGDNEPSDPNDLIAWFRRTHPDSVKEIEEAILRDEPERLMAEIDIPF
jgi:hypothetical protein